MRKVISLLVFIFVSIFFVNVVFANAYIIGPFYADKANVQFDNVKTGFDNKIDQMYFMWGRVTRDQQRNLVFTTANDRSISLYDKKFTTYGFPGDKSLLDFKARCPQGKAFLSVFFSTNSDGSDAIDLLNMTQNQWKDNIIDPMLKFAREQNFNGIVLDFEGFRDSYNNSEYSTDKQIAMKYKYDDFVSLLKSYLVDLKLIVCVHPTNVSGYYDGYNFTALNKLCDYIILMAYDYQNEDKNGNLHIFQTQPFYKIDAAVSKIIDKDKTGSGISVEKLILGMNLGVIKWIKIKKTTGENQYKYYYTKVDGTRFLDDVEKLTGEESYDDISKTQRKIILGINAIQGDKTFYEKSDEKIEQVEYYYETPTSFQEKYLNIVKSYNLAGVSVWRLGLGSETTWKGLVDIFYNNTDTDELATPEPSPESLPTPSPEATPTLEPSPTPTASATPRPTLEPSPTPTASATQRPNIRPSPTPTASATPKSTKKPTVTPIPLKSKNTNITSSKYKVNILKSTIAINQKQVNLSTFKTNIKFPKGSTNLVLKADGKSIVSKGDVISGMKVKVTAEDRKTQKIYTIIK